MKSIICLLTLILTVQGCSTDESNVTELEGTWSSICLGGFSGFSGFSFDLFDTTVSSPSQKIITTYHGNNVSTQVEAYEDADCSTLLLTTDASQSTLFVEPGLTPATFSIGEVTKSSNGVTVREIDFFTVDDEIMPNIYLLQDNGNTLYLGMLSCPVATQPGVMPDLSACLSNRPTEIFYDFPYTRVN